MTDRPKRQDACSAISRWCAQKEPRITHGEIVDALLSAVREDLAPEWDQHDDVVGRVEDLERRIEPLEQRDCWRGPHYIGCETSAIDCCACVGHDRYSTGKHDSGAFGCPEGDHQASDCYDAARRATLREVREAWETPGISHVEFTAALRRMEESCSSPRASSESASGSGSGISATSSATGEGNAIVAADAPTPEPGSLIWVDDIDKRPTPPDSGVRAIDLAVPGQHELAAEAGLPDPDEGDAHQERFGKCKATAKSIKTLFSGMGPVNKYYDYIRELCDAYERDHAAVEQMKSECHEWIIRASKHTAERNQAEAALAAERQRREQAEEQIRWMTDR